ncbi:MAG: hypothetical protein EBY52_04765 [Actinobacteria bacterium]|nr:hypothetical protein [Actinomycetota bacterium]
MNDGHTHAHRHGMAGGWERWIAVPTLRAVLAAVTLAAVATIVGVIVLWPTGEGRDAAISNAADLGLVTERVGATVEEQTVGPCSYSSVENPQECREITAILTSGPEDGSLIILPEINTEFQSGIPDLSPGDTIILGFEPATNAYFYADLDRQAPLVWLAILFAIVVFALGRRRGLMALASMAVTVFVLVVFIAPSVLDGNDPVAVAVVATDEARPLIGVVDDQLVDQRFELVAFHCLEPMRSSDRLGVAAVLAGRHLTEDLLGLGCREFPAGLHLDQHR